VLWGVLAVGVILATTVVARRELSSPPRSPVAAAQGAIAAAPELDDAGILLGDSAAPIKIVEFSDFECRYCRALQPTLAELRRRHPGSVAIVYRHFPLSRVGFAVPAAVAAECAAAQGLFEPFAELLFASQDTLSRLALEKTAHQAGILDTAQFRACRNGQAARARVAEDIAAGMALGITATPTLFFGGQRRVGDVPLDQLESMLGLEIESAGPR
jgi:protein-disulfide isomerase